MLINRFGLHKKIVIVILIYLIICRAASWPALKFYHSA
jgi:hypothetical protein